MLTRSNHSRGKVTMFLPLSRSLYAIFCGLFSRSGSRRAFPGALARPLVRVLVLSLALPVPMAGSASARDGDDGVAHVHVRLNSPERARTIEEARAKDAEMLAAAVQETASPTVAADRGAAPAKTASSAVKPEQRQASAPRPAAVNVPKSLGQALMEPAAAFMGVPGFVGMRQDEGLGFHQDGTVRKAGGEGSASGYGGSRSASYAGHGMGYGPYGSGYSGMREPGCDPVTGWNFRTGDGTAGGRRGAGLPGFYGNFDPMSATMQRGLNYGLGFLNSAGEAAFSGLVDGGRSRLNFSTDLDGRTNGEGDVLLPFWDSQYTTIYTQLGARSMSGIDGGDRDDGTGADRWIGNAGLGQRWFPFARDMSDAGDLMLGYNAFYDYDFTRSHQRGGFGVEAQYDWLRLASNYYFPISDWRDSKDFDGDFVKERPAQGWDVRAKGHIPFYRNMAVTGAYSQWYGDHVGMFSSSKLEKNPRVWSYGLEYTPVPLVSGFGNQRSTENGRSDTEFGLRFTYHFNMPWEDQISHSKVAELRTVSGSRHEFVDRENRIILEYKAKNSYRIEYVGPDGSGFLFRVRDGFGNYMAGQTVRVTASGTYLAEAGAKAAPAGAPSLFAQVVNFFDGLISVKAAYAAGFTAKSYVTDSRGRFWVQLDPTAPNRTTVIMQAGDNSQTFTLAGEGVVTVSYAYDLSALTVASNGNLGGTIRVTNSSTGADASGVAVTLSYATSGGSGTATATTVSLGDTNASGEVSVTGQNVTALARRILFTANNDAASAVTRTVGTIPSGFLTGASLGKMDWSTAGAYCRSQGGKLPRMNNSDSTPGPVTSIDGFGAPGNAWPSGLPSELYWSGTESSDLPGLSWIVHINNGKVLDDFGLQTGSTYAVCVP